MNDFKNSLKQSIITGYWWWEPLLGYHTNIAYDFRELLSNLDFLDFLWNKLKSLSLNEQINFVAGDDFLIDTLGIFLKSKIECGLLRVGLVSHVSEGILPWASFEVRQDAKISEGDKVLLLDNVFVTGATLWRQKEILEGEGAKVIGSLVIIDSCLDANSSSELIKQRETVKNSLQIYSLFNLSELDTLEQNVHSAATCKECNVREIRIPYIGRGL